MQNTNELKQAIENTKKTKNAWDEEMICETPTPKGQTLYDHLYQMHYQKHQAKYLAKKLGNHPSNEAIERAITNKDSLIPEMTRKVIDIKAKGSVKSYIDDLLEEAEIQRKINETGRSKANAWQAMKFLVKERQHFIDEILGVINEEPKDEVIDYLKRDYQIDINHSNYSTMIDSFRSILGVSYLHYMQIQRYFNGNLDDTCFDFVYDLYKLMRRTLKPAEKILGIFAKSEIDLLDKILGLIKPHLSKSYHEFNNKFSRFMDIKKQDEKLLKMQSALKSEILSTKNFMDRVMQTFKHECSKYYQEEEVIAINDGLVDLEEISNFLGKEELWSTKNANHKGKESGIKNLGEYEIRGMFNSQYLMLILMREMDKKMQQQKENFLKEMKKNKVQKDQQKDQVEGQDHNKTEAGKPNEVDDNKNLSSKNEDHEKEFIDILAVEEEDEKNVEALANFKKQKSDALRAWKEQCRQAIEAKQAFLSYLNQDLSEDAPMGPEIMEDQSLQTYEVTQLRYVFENIRRHYDTLEALMNGGKVEFKALEALIFAVSRDLIEPEKFTCFSLIKRPGSSHFSAYVPNTRKDWKKAMEGRASLEIQMKKVSNVFELTPRQMSTVNSWDHSREIHSGGPMSLRALKRAREGFVRSGITPDRIQLALNINPMMNPRGGQKNPR